MIVTKQERIDYFRQVTELASEPKEGQPFKVYKQAVRCLRHYGIEREDIGKFRDNGMSNKFLCRILGCGNATLKKVVDNGQDRNIFKRIPMQTICVVMDNRWNTGKDYVQYSQDQPDLPVLFVAEHYVVYLKKCASYKLYRCEEAGFMLAI